MTDNDEDKTAPAVRTIRTSPRAWKAWGRVLAQLDTNRTERIHEVMREDIEQHGTEEDRADLAAGQHAQEEAAARKRLGRMPTPTAPREAGGANETRTDPAEDPEHVQDAAMHYAREHFPQAPAAHRAAFANSVCEAVTGWTGGWGGPSVREHAAAQIFAPGPRPTYEEAVEQLGDPNGLIFGPITDLHRAVWAEEHCFDDAEDDVAALVL